jgi:DNA-binding NtrC family response regulator
MDLQRPRLLVVDDDRGSLTLAGNLGFAEGFETSTTPDLSDALAQLRRRPADLVLVDLQMPGVTGLDVLHAIRAASSRSSVAFMTAAAIADDAVEAVKLGAVEYMTKPLDAARLRQLLNGVRADGHQRRAVLALERDLAQQLEFCGMIGRGPAMQDVFAIIRRLAPHARAVLVTGEPGTGKQLAARALHALGSRSSKRFVTVNCSAAVDTLFARELFGHARGAFPGALEHKPGLFETANGGSLYLDEVGELPLSVQATLLRVLETGEVQRVGSTQTRKVDVQVIAATSRDLIAEVAGGQFRGDLYDHLNTAEVVLPPLRDRREDIPFLTAAFIRACSQRFKKPLVGPTTGAERMLAHAPWEGNVRQLRNVLERACMVGDGEYITESDLTGILRDQRVSIATRTIPMGHSPAAAPVVTVQRDQIVRTLQRVRGNKAVAARLLGISRRAFYRQLERHGLHHRVAAVSRVPADARYDVETV